jgi:hypothetical protein
MPSNASGDRAALLHVQLVTSRRDPLRQPTRSPLGFEPEALHQPPRLPCTLGSIGRRTIDA